MINRALNRLYDIDRLAGGFRSVVLVCGFRHSGTTLICQILSTSEDVYSAYDEERLFRAYRPLLSRKSLANFLSVAQASGKPIALSKKPRSIDSLPIALSILPNLRIVIPVRDGRDAVASTVVRGIPFEKALDRWVADAQTARRFAQDARVLVYNHEALVAQPAETVRRVCEHIGLEYSDGLLDYHKKPRHWFRQTEIRKGSGTTKEEHNALRNWQVNQPIFDNSGKWKTILSEEQVRHFGSGEVARLMGDLGYDESGLNRRLIGTQP